jgi:hypothetical protein
MVPLAVLAALTLAQQPTPAAKRQPKVTLPPVESRLELKRARVKLSEPLRAKLVVRVKGKSPVTLQFAAEHDVEWSIRDLSGKPLVRVPETPKPLEKPRERSFPPGKHEFELSTPVSALKPGRYLIEARLASKERLASAVTTLDLK